MPLTNEADSTEVPRCDVTSIVPVHELYARILHRPCRAVSPRTGKSIKEHVCIHQRWSHPNELVLYRNIARSHHKDLISTKVCVYHTNNGNWCDVCMFCTTYSWFLHLICDHTAKNLFHTLNGVMKIMTVWSWKLMVWSKFLRCDQMLMVWWNDISVWTNVHFLEIVWSHRMVWSMHMFFSDVCLIVGSRWR